MTDRHFRESLDAWLTTEPAEPEPECPQPCSACGPDGCDPACSVCEAHWQAIARVFYAVHHRQAAAEAAEQEAGQ